MIARIHSTTLKVSDQDKALQFYTNVLGWEKREDSTLPDGYRWLTVAPAGAETALVLDKADAGQASGGGGGYTGISLISDDLQRDYETLSAKGVAFKEPPARMPWGDIATWFSDPDGNEFFVVQVAAQG